MKYTSNIKRTRGTGNIIHKISQHHNILLYLTIRFQSQSVFEHALTLIYEIFRPFGLILWPLWKKKKHKVNNTSCWCCSEIGFHLCTQFYTLIPSFIVWSIFPFINIGAFLDLCLLWWAKCFPVYRTLLTQPFSVIPGTSLVMPQASSSIVLCSRADEDQQATSKAEHGIPSR